MTVLLARSRQTVAAAPASVAPAAFAAELISLPSGLLAMVCEAIVKLKVRACVRFGCMGPGRGPTRSLRVHSACQSSVTVV